VRGGPACRQKEPLEEKLTVEKGANTVRREKGKAPPLRREGFSSIGAGNRNRRWLREEALRRADGEPQPFGVLREGGRAKS
jgi:hypothetical protein